MDESQVIQRLKNQEDSLKDGLEDQTEEHE